jgi:ADP-heptose:LPS heptosyltransferase
LLSGAPTRLGATNSIKPKLIQRICYTKIFHTNESDISYFDLHFKLLAGCGIYRPKVLELEIACNPLFSEAANKLLPTHSIICHIATSQPKKDWPITHWKALNDLSDAAGLNLVFSSGTNERELKLLAEFRKIAPEAATLEPITNLDLFLNVLQTARLVIAGDTGPLHFACGLRVPTIGLFAVGNSIRQIAPLYKHDEIIMGGFCECSANSASLDYCIQKNSCMSSISPETVMLKIQKMLASGQIT